MNASRRGRRRLHHHLEPCGRHAARQARGAHELCTMPGRARRRTTRVGQSRQIHHRLEPRGRHAVIHARGTHQRGLVPGRARRRPARVGSGDSSIILWNPADGAQLGTLEGHTGSVQCLTTLDGGRLASGGDDTSIIIWNLADGRQLTKHEGHTAMVRCLATLDGGNLASAAADETIRIRPVLHSAAYKFTAFGRVLRSSLRRSLVRVASRAASTTSSPPLPCSSSTKILVA